MENDSDTIEGLRKWEENHEKSSEVLDAEPEITRSIEWLWNAFWELSGGRGRGMGIEFISYSDIHSYCVLNWYNQEESEELCKTVKAMDLVFVEVLSKKED